MKWTKALPDVAGEYWWRENHDKPGRVLRVSEWPGGGFVVWFPAKSNHSDGIAAVEQIGGLWQGPLRCPPMGGGMSEHDFPQPGALIPLKEAKATNRCRICGEVVCGSDGKPIGWRDEFGRMTFPLRITLNFGEEFAHTDCLEKS